MPSKVAKIPAADATTYLIGLDERASALLAASVRDVLVRIDNVCAITGLSVPTIYRLMNQERFPRPVKITNTARAWKLSEVAAWVDSREPQRAHRSDEKCADSSAHDERE
jgi:prophage regulatory protein